MSLRFIKNSDCDKLTEDAKYSCQEVPPGGTYECSEGGRGEFQGKQGCLDCLNSCGKNVPPIKPIIKTKPTDLEKSNNNKILWNKVWPPMTIIIGLLLLCLLIWYFTRPKKSQFAVYWRR